MRTRLSLIFDKIYDILGKISPKILYLWALLGIFSALFPLMDTFIFAVTCIGISRDENNIRPKAYLYTFLLLTACAWIPYGIGELFRSYRR